MTHARRALDLVSEDDHLGRGAASALLGLAYWTSGDLEAAHAAYVDGMASLETGRAHLRRARLRHRPGRYPDRAGASPRGHAHVRAGTAARDGQGAPVLRGTADMHVGMSELHRERNDLEAATQHLLTSPELGERARACRRTRIAGASRRLGSARPRATWTVRSSCSTRRSACTSSDFFPECASGRGNEGTGVDRAGKGSRRRWTGRVSMAYPPRTSLSYLREFEHITLARVLLAQGRRIGRAASLEAVDARWSASCAADDGGQNGKRHRNPGGAGARPSRSAATSRLRLRRWNGPLALAEPEGYVRVFVDEGPPMAALLKRRRSSGSPRATCADSLAAVGTAEGQPPGRQPLIEPLSERELEVLRLLGATSTARTWRVSSSCP